MKYLALAVVLAGCGRAPSHTEAMAPAPAPAGDPHAQIDALDRDIADAMARAKLAAPSVDTCSGATCAQAMSTPFTAPRVGDAACRPASIPRCSDSCTLSTSICDNQVKICDLAGQLPGDDWAANKCSSARASCHAARDACCSCL